MLPKPSSLSRQPQKWNVTKPCPGHPLYYYTRGKKTLMERWWFNLMAPPRNRENQTTFTPSHLNSRSGSLASPDKHPTLLFALPLVGLHPQMFHLGLVLILSRNEHTPRLSSIKANTIRKMREWHIGQMFLWAVSSVPPLTFRWWPRERYTFKLMGKK